MAVEVSEVTVLVRSPVAKGVRCADNDCERFVLSAAKLFYDNGVFY